MNDRMTHDDLLELLRSNRMRTTDASQWDENRRNAVVECLEKNIRKKFYTIFSLRMLFTQILRAFRNWLRRNNAKVNVANERNPQTEILSLLSFLDHMSSVTRESPEKLSEIEKLAISLLRRMLPLLMSTGEWPLKNLALLVPRNNRLEIAFEVEALVEKISQRVLIRWKNSSMINMRSQNTQGLIDVLVTSMQTLKPTSDRERTFYTS